MENRKTVELFHIGEDLAAKYLAAQGYNILCKNFRSDAGEIDIIASDKDNLVFVEVKTRSRHSMKLALMSISYTKRKRISLTAQRYITLNPDKVKPKIRFDVIVVFYYPETDSYKIEHLQDAFVPVF